MFSRKKLIGFSLAFIPTVSWASFYIVSRFAFGENEDVIDPVFFSFLRYFIAGIFMFALIIHQKKFKAMASAMKTDLWMFVFLGITGVVLEGTLLFWSLKYTTAARSSLFANTSPIFTVLIAIFALNEKPDHRKILGMLIGFAGTFIAIVSRSKGDLYLTSSGILGDLLAMGSGICWAAYTVWGTGVSSRYGSFISASIVIIFGSIMLFAVVLLTGRPMLWNFPAKLWIATIYLGLMTNAVAYLCWYAALKYLKAGELGAFGYISAILTVILSFTLLHEKFTFSFFLALTGVIAGVYLMMEKDSGKVRQISENALQ
ncbi:MAG: hypothetical protein A2017_22065 [Lentisphaerae bacterium GWF2_44_16]|nr:MAG: hypothetical protein A2017_22065 [Lentisphaerae bacterium GWF2_44_16]